MKSRHDTHHYGKRREQQKKNVIEKKTRMARKDSGGVCSLRALCNAWSLEDSRKRGCFLNRVNIDHSPE